MHAGRISGAQNRAQVVWIFDTVQYDEQRRPLGPSDQFIQAVIWCRLEISDDALMHAAKRVALKRVLWNPTNPNTLLSCQRHDLGYTPSAPPPDPHFFDSTGAQRLQDGVDTVNDHPWGSPSAR
jgi:hypothetical protein